MKNSRIHNLPVVTVEAVTTLPQCSPFLQAPFFLLGDECTAPLCPGFDHRLWVLNIFKLMFMGHGTVAATFIHESHSIPLR